jgi:hypothetical protein
MHIPRFQATTASMVCSLPANGGPLRAWACLGAPCVSVYVPFFLPVVPGYLADAQQWQRITRLRDRIDADHDALATVRGVLDPVELELWDAADALVEAGPDDWLRFTDTCGARIDRALADLGV